MVFRKKKQAAATPVDKIESWKAADPTDKRELKIYVDNGCCDGLTPIDVMNKFPQFRDYATKTFSSALQTARKSHNKCIHDRHRAGFEGFSGLHPRNNLGSIAEGKECASVDDDDWERVSAVTEGTSFDSMADVESSFKSMKLTVRDANDDKKKFVRIDTTTHHICAKDVWEDSKGNRRISVQLETDSANYKSDKIRVSTDGWEIVNYTELSDNITDPKRALDYTDLDPTSAEAAWHPRIIARKKTIAQARGRDPNHAKVVVKSRYRLPFKVRHVFATKADGDPFFHGKKTIMYQDGETHHHIELVEMKRDGYDPEKSDPSVHQARGRAPNASNASVPASVQFGGPSPMEEDGTSQTGNAKPTVLDDGYDGDGATRASIKRKASKQERVESEDASELEGNWGDEDENSLMRGL